MCGYAGTCWATGQHRGSQVVQHLEALVGERLLLVGTAWHVVVTLPFASVALWLPFLGNRGFLAGRLANAEAATYSQLLASGGK